MLRTFLQPFQIEPVSPPVDRPRCLYTRAPLVVYPLENAGDNTTVCPVAAEEMMGVTSSAFGRGPNSTTVFYKALFPPGPWWAP